MTMLGTKEKLGRGAFGEICSRRQSLVVPLCPMSRFTWNHTRL